ncbi:MAG: DUF6958 family protein [Shimia sp.]
MSKDTIEVLNRNGSPHRVGREKFEHVSAVLMAALPEGTPGMTFAEVKEAVRDGLGAELFPGGAKMGWWLKTVQLDHEARGMIARSETSPLRFWKTPL